MDDKPTPQAGPPAVLVHVEVTNFGYPLETMWDGVPYRFPTGVPVAISPQVAQHCFGYPGEFRDMAMYMARRYGWATTETMKWTEHGKPAYFEMAEKFKFQPVYYDLVRRKPDDPIPALPDNDGDDEAREASEQVPQEPKSATVVGRNAKYGKASRDKRKRLEDKKPTKAKTRRTTHLNVTEA